MFKAVTVLFWKLVRLFLRGGDFWDSSRGVTAVCNCNDGEGNSGVECIIFFLLNMVTHM